MMAFEYMKYKQGISYIGVDNNVYWRKIHNFIKENFKGGGVKFKRNIDVLTYFEKNELHKCNVIIIQYLISFFFETIGEDGIRMNITVRRSRQSGVARATCPD